MKIVGEQGQVGKSVDRYATTVPTWSHSKTRAKRGQADCDFPHMGSESRPPLGRAARFGAQYPLWLHFLNFKLGRIEMVKKVEKPSAHDYQTFVADIFRVLPDYVVGDLKYGDSWNGGEVLLTCSVAPCSAARDVEIRLSEVVGKDPGELWELVRSKLGG